MKLQIAQRASKKINFELEFDEAVDLSQETVQFIVGTHGKRLFLIEPEIFEIEGENRGVRVKLTAEHTKDSRLLNYEIWINFEGFGWVRQVRDNLEILRSLPYED